MENTTKKTGKHWPLDIPTMPFSRYEHRPLNAQDIMVHRIMAEFMKPSSQSAARFWTDKDSPFSDLARGHLHRERFEDHATLNTDIHVLNQMLCSKGPSIPWSQLPLLSSPFPTYGDRVLNMIMRHYLESDDCCFRLWVAREGPPRLSPWSNTKGNGVGDWTEDDRAHLQKLSSQIAVQDRYPLYNGGFLLPPISRRLDYCDGSRPKLDRRHAVMPGAQWAFSFTPFPERDNLGDWFHRRELPSRFMIQPRWDDLQESSLFRYVYFLLNWSNQPVDFSINPGRGPDRDGHWSTGWHPSHSLPRRWGGRRSRPRRRCTSEPPFDSFAIAELPRHDPFTVLEVVQVIFPRMKLSQLDRRSRRRSLSRTRVEEMFDWDVDSDSVCEQPHPPHHLRHCENCMGILHKTSECDSPCGHCGAPDDSSSATRRLMYAPEVQRYSKQHQNPHRAPDCPVSRKNRCKCIDFPTFHTASQCTVTCHRDCGNPARPGTFQHLNAMLCKYRCCMCGIRGHSGKECRNQKCRCGRRHLGQDCGWNPTCRQPGCDRFLCGIHCRRCGSTEDVYGMWYLCWRCRGEPGPRSVGGKRGRRRKRDSVDEAEALSVPSAPATEASHTDMGEGTGYKSIFGDPTWSFKKDD